MYIRTHTRTLYAHTYVYTLYAHVYSILQEQLHRHADIMTAFGRPSIVVKLKLFVMPTVHVHCRCTERAVCVPCVGHHVVGAVCKVLVL